MSFRTKTIKNSKLVQLVESYRNAEGQPRQRVVVSLGNAVLPNDEMPARLSPPSSWLQVDLLSSPVTPASREAAG